MQQAIGGRDRLAWAWAVSPLAAVVVIGLAIATLGRATYTWPSWTNWIESLGGTVLVFLVFGLPVAYFVELVVGGPAYWLLRWKRLLGLAPVLFVGAAAGCVTFTVVTALFLGAWDWLFAGVVGALAGVVSAALFWTIGLRGVSGGGSAGEAQ